LLTVEIGYPDEARVRRWIEQEGYALADSAYQMAVRLTISMPVTAVTDAHEALRDMTQGRALFASD
jgi:putative IMPACT (imprinted ancient) family translation regulator